MQKLRKEYDNVDVDGFMAWAYIEHPIWFKRKYREYLNWCLLNNDEINEQMQDCGLLYIADGKSKRKCRECGKTKDWDEFVNDATPICVECAENIGTSEEEIGEW